MPRSLLASRHVVTSAFVLLVTTFAPSVARPAGADSQLLLEKQGSTNVLRLEQIGVFHTTANPIQNWRLVQLPDSNAQLALWEEQDGGRVVAFYAIIRDGQRAAAVRRVSYDVLLRHSRFDPLVAEPLIADLVAAKDSNIYVVQFWTQPLDEYRESLRRAGASIYKYIANHAYLVKMNPEVRNRVRAFPFVRWVGAYHPAYRLEEFLLEEYVLTRVVTPELRRRLRRFNIQVFERGNAQQDAVAQRIEAVGGTVHSTNPLGFRLEATLTPDQLLSVAAMDEVLFIDRWSPAEVDMDVAREIGGANFIENTLGFTGAGVRGEIMDLNMSLRATHVDYQAMPPLLHGATTGSGGHGNSTYGIIFGTGTENLNARGMLPGAQGIFAPTLGGAARYAHTAELLQEPYLSVFQSNSWGNAQTTAYTTVSAEMDDILFTHDILITQSQSNTRNQNSRPQAWAKNIVSVGGIKHFNTLDMSDDCWGCTPGGASIGPAADGRIKPDLAHFYDLVFTVGGSTDTGYTNFGGTSAATPIVAGHFGLFFEMWHNGLFGNPTGPSVFDSRPHMTTSKAMMINTARSWSFSGSDDDLSRAKQGWGMPDLATLYERGTAIGVVDETDILSNLGSTSYYTDVQSDPPPAPLRMTLVYADPPGTTSSSQHRINDLTLRVTSPSGVVYWGNNGLLAGLWSEPDGEPNTNDTVENVFIETPEPGVWAIDVIASEINEDSHLETPEVDADYALVVSGILIPPPTASRDSRTLPSAESRLRRLKR